MARRDCRRSADEHATHLRFLRHLACLPPVRRRLCRLSREIPARRRQHDQHRDETEAKLMALCLRLQPIDVVMVPGPAQRRQRHQQLLCASAGCAAPLALPRRHAKHDVGQRPMPTALQRLSLRQQDGHRWHAPMTPARRLRAPLSRMLKEGDKGAAGACVRRRLKLI